MSKTKDFLAEPEDKAAFAHPVLKYLAGISNKKVSISVYRPKDILGFKSARMFLNVQDKPPAEYPWDGDLDDALISHGVRAQEREDEIMRFAMALRRSFKVIETRYGEGFFNAVLVNYVKVKGLADEPPVADVFAEIRQAKPYENGHSAQDCEDAIVRALKHRASEIQHKLKYDVDEAASIFAGALAQYLDERFSVTDGKKFGWK